MGPSLRLPDYRSEEEGGYSRQNRPQFDCQTGLWSRDRAGVSLVQNENLDDDGHCVHQILAAANQMILHPGTADSYLDKVGLALRPGRLLVAVAGV